MPHVHTIKVRGFHLDLYGHVNNARYLEFLEEARWELFEGKIDLDEWRRSGLTLTVVRITINYRREVRLGETLEVRSTLSELKSRSGTFRQEIVFAESGEIAADADVTFVIVDARTARAAVIRGDFRESLLSLGNPADIQ
ncbi:MAG: acyl-CoA thioesterase [Chitinivibrionia bacterium]|nr:acyl-CoA thioesterase [Chitinivibrionia bacterium]